MKRHWVLLLAPLWATTACSGEEPPAEVIRTRVRVEAAKVDTVRDTVTLHAEIEGTAQTRLNTLQGGTVEWIRVKEGDTVTKGQLLAKIGSQTATSQLKQAEAAHKSAKNTLERQQKLAAQELASPAAIEQAEGAFAQAEAMLNQARVGHGNAIMAAPHGGMVARRFVERGETLAPGAPVFEVVDVSGFKVVTEVAERDVPLLDLGRDAWVAVDALPDVKFPGSISRIGAVADPSSRTFTVEVAAKNVEGRLRPGMLARVTIVRRKIDDTVTTRRDAVLEDQSGAHVFVVTTDGTAAKRPVKLGPSESNLVAITQGLKVGEQVVTVGHRVLVDGQPIQIVDPEPPPTAQKQD